MERSGLARLESVESQEKDGEKVINHDGEVVREMKSSDHQKMWLKVWV